MTNAQTEARASLWVPAKPEHAKLGWTYDFEQTERISNAAYEGTGYGATMEVVEFVMAEADRRHRDSLAAKDAELAREKLEHDVTFQKAVNYSARLKEAEAKFAEANKALDLAIEALTEWGEAPEILDPIRRAREAQGGE